MSENEARFRFEALDVTHETSAFNSRSTALDIFLKNEAAVEQEQDLSRTFVLLDAEASPDAVIAGYFTLRAEAQYFPSEDGIKRNCLPLVEICFLARDYRYYGQEIVDVLLVEAITYVAAISELVGVAGVFLRATDEGKRLYSRYGFVALEEYEGDKTMFLPIRDIRGVLDTLETS